MDEEECEGMTRARFLRVAASGLVGTAAAVAGCTGDGTPTADAGSPTPTDSPTPGDSGETDGSATTETEAGTDETTETAGDNWRGTAIKVDQTGYRPGEEAVGVVVPAVESVAVETAGDGSRVGAGALGAALEEPEAGETVREVALPDLDPGEYVLRAGGHASRPFEIRPGLYEGLLADVGRLYTLKRSNTRIEDPETGLAIGPGHTQDAEARMYFSDQFHEEGERVDVAGGWYDAGDYGKYVTPAAITVGQHLLAYDLAPGAFSAGQYDLPPGVSPDDRGTMPDVLVEAKFELEWLLTMQRPDGAVYHKVSGKQWPGLDVRPTEDTQTRYVFGLATYTTGMFAGATALAARVYREFDGSFADRLLSAARDAQSYLADNPESYFRSDPGQNSGSGAYAKEGDEPERFWAAAELLRTTGERRYADHLHAELDHLFGRDPAVPSWANALAMGQWAYRNAEGADDGRRGTLREGFLSTADGVLEEVRSDGYRNALTAEEYYWGSNKVAAGKGLLLCLADAIDADRAYRQAAREQLHYLLGRSPTGYSYVVGYGEQHTRNPHDRIVVSTGTRIPGMMVGGPNDDGGGPTLEAYLESESPPPAKAYVDDREAYACNEWAIDYTAPLLFDLAYLGENA